MSDEALINLRARTQGAKESLVQMLDLARGEDAYRLSHKINGVKLVLSYIDDAIRDERAR